MYLDLSEARAGCAGCTLFPASRITPQVRGESGAPNVEDVKMILIGEAPGEAESLEGRPFVGKAGTVLRSVLLELLIPTRAVYITNAVKCRPPDNRIPTKDEQIACSGFLKRELAMFPNALRVALGATAASNLLGRKVSVQRDHSQVFDSPYGKVFVAFHPAAVLYNPGTRALFEGDLRSAWRVAREGEAILPPVPTKLLNAKAIEYINRHHPTQFVLDVETCGSLNPYAKDARLLLVGLLPTHDPSVVLQITDHSALVQLGNYLNSPFVSLVGHNLKYDVGWLLSLGLIDYSTLANRALVDTMVQYAYINENSPKSLKALCRSLFNLPDWSTVVKDVNGRLLNMSEVPLETLLDYNAYDLYFTYMLWDYERTRLRTRVALLMSKSTFVISGLESAGVKIDLDKLAKLRDDTVAEEARLLEILTKVVKNPKSTKQLQEVLYTRFKLPVLLKTEKERLPSCDKQALRMLLSHSISKEAEEFITTLLEYRGKAKLSSTYIDSYFTRLSTQRTTHQDIIHPEYWAVRNDGRGTSTGRLSSSNPNFQNQPAIMRTVYKSRHENGTLLAIDLSQIELRILAIMSKDSALVNIFSTGKDLHGEVANAVVRPNLDDSLGLSADSIRRIAKTINFGIAYKVSAKGLRAQLKAAGVTLSLDTAESLITNWYKRFRGVGIWQAKIEEEVLTTGKVLSIFERARHLPGASETTATGREVLRQAVNAPIQGAAADLVTYGIMPALMSSLSTMRSCAIINRHDEVVLDIHPEEKEEVARLIKLVLSNPPLPRSGMGMECETWNDLCKAVGVDVPMRYEEKPIHEVVVVEEDEDNA